MEIESASASPASPAISSTNSSRSRPPCSNSAVITSVRRTTAISPTKGERLDEDPAAEVDHPEREEELGEDEQQQHALEDENA